MVLQDLESKRENKIIFYVSWSVKQEFWLLFTDIQGGVKYQSGNEVQIVHRGGSPGLVIMGEDSCSRGSGF